jgi:hypothetical protein
MPPTLLCRCGHPRTVHEHYRPGSDCGLCGDTVCPGWRPPRWWWRWLRRYAFQTAEIRRLQAEVVRLSGAQQKLRNVIALRPYNDGRTA